MNGSFGPNSNSPVATFAGSRYTLNLTEDIVTIRVRSAWSNAKIGSTVYATVLVAVYEVDKVLMPMIEMDIEAWLILYLKKIPILL